MLGRCGRKCAYPVIALAFSVIDVLSIVATGASFTFVYVGLHIVTVTAVGLIPWYPRVAAHVGLLGCVALLLLPSELVGGGVLSALSNVLIVDRISRGWWRSSLIYYAAIIAASLLSPQMLSLGDAILSVLLQLFVVLSIGLMMYSINQQLTAASLLREKEIIELRLALAQQLHDGVATDLTKALLMSRLLVDQTQDQQERQDLELIERSTHNALQELRSISATLKEEHKLPARVSDVVQEAQVLIARRGQRMINDLHGDSELESALGSLGYDLLLLFLREGLTNCHKYAAKKGVVRLWSNIDMGMFEAVIVSERDPHSHARPSSALSSGMGIENLARRAAVLGGSVTALPTDKQWILTLEIPLKNIERP